MLGWNMWGLGCCLHMALGGVRGQVVCGNGLGKGLLVLCVWNRPWCCYCELSMRVPPSRVTALGSAALPALCTIVSCHKARN